MHGSRPSSYYGEKKKKKKKKERYLPPELPPSLSQKKEKKKKERGEKKARKKVVECHLTGKKKKKKKRQEDKNSKCSRNALGLLIPKGERGERIPAFSMRRKKKREGVYGARQKVRRNSWALCLWKERKKREEKGRGRRPRGRRGSRRANTLRVPTGKKKKGRKANEKIEAASCRPLSDWREKKRGGVRGRRRTAACQNKL